MASWVRRSRGGAGLRALRKQVAKQALVWVGSKNAEQQIQVPRMAGADGQIVWGFFKSATDHLKIEDLLETVHVERADQRCHAVPVSTHVDGR